MDYTELLKDKVVRIEAMRESFPLFFAYHFGWNFKDFQIKRLRAMQSDKNVFLEAFRASRKTTIAKWYIIWRICYKTTKYSVRQTFDDEASSSSVRDIAKMLLKDSIVEDYWMLFPLETKKSDLAKRSLSNFETTNGVKVQSRSLWQTLRWANDYNSEEEKTERPDTLVLDDIDVLRSVLNPKIINQNESKIVSETIGAMDPTNRKIILLWNTIFNDWVVPRFYQKYKDKETWECFRQPLINEHWQNIRPEVFTEDVVQDLMDDWKTSWNQNYLLIPSTMWDGAFTQDYFDYFLLSHFELDSVLKKQDIRCCISIDPAFSTNSSSDDAVVIWWWEHNISKQVYLIDWYSWTSAPSRTIDAVIAMYNNMKAKWFAISFISVEDVKINKAQTAFIDLLRQELIRHGINVPLYLYSPRISKEIRVKDTLEPIMSKKWIKFNRNIAQIDFIPKLERQLLEFPNWDHDDHPDCLAQLAEMLKKYYSWWENQKPIQLDLY